MVKKIEASKRFQARIPASLMQKIEDCRTEYARQGLKINMSAAVQTFLEREVKRMEKELRQANPDFEPGQSEMDL